MISIDPKLKEERDVYKIMTGTILPRPVAFVTSLSEENVLNGAPFSYFNIVSTEPALISLAIQRRNGEMKDTARNILFNKCFVVSVVDKTNVHEINKTASSLKPSESELELTSLTVIKSDNIIVPGIKESKVRMECVLEKHIKFGTEEHTTTDLIIGRVVKFHLDESIYDNGYINVANLSPISRLEGHNYASIGNVFTIERPK